MAPTSLRKQRAEQAQRRFARLKDGAVLCRLHQRNRVVRRPRMLSVSETPCRSPAPNFPRRSMG